MAHTALRGVRGLEITRALLNSIWLNQHLFDAHRKERERERKRERRDKTFVIIKLD